MLQQTQVSAVIPYYERFLRAFPTVNRLVAAPFEKVAVQWSGLGYYRRARHLHTAARELVEAFDGQFPRDYDTARTLPGVGHYTASAVLSIAYGQPLPVLDGNVARVVSRLNAVRGNVAQSAFRRKVEKWLQQTISVTRPGDFNQAMMELGQLICLPRSPRCGACPLVRDCFAIRQDDPEAFPEPRPRRKPEIRHLAVAIIVRDGKVALVRGLEEGLLQDLWNFPSAFGASPGDALARLTDKYFFQIQLHQRIGTTRHSITFRSIRVSLYAASANLLPAARWFTHATLHTSATSQLARKIASVARL